MRSYLEKTAVIQKRIWARKIKENNSPLMIWIWFLNSACAVYMWPCTWPNFAPIVFPLRNSLIFVKDRHFWWKSHSFFMEKGFSWSQTFWNFLLQWKIEQNFLRWMPIFFSLSTRKKVFLMTFALYLCMNSFWPYNTNTELDGLCRRRCVDYLQRPLLHTEVCTLTTQQKPINKGCDDMKMFYSEAFMCIYCWFFSAICSNIMFTVAIKSFECFK